MKYELVTLKEKTAAAVCARTNNLTPDMGTVIGGLWEQFFETGLHGNILGLYTEYAGDETSDYTAAVGVELSEPTSEVLASIPDSMKLFHIPAGTYAKFIVKGHVQHAVAEFWQRLWSMDLPRSFVCDFEDYQAIQGDQAEVHIYIGLR